LKRYFIELSYNGKKFFGWQRQPRQISVQEEIETAITKLYSNKEISLVGCGRTDTGVHAKSYFLHVELPHHDVLKDLNQFIIKLNKMLPASIVLHEIFESEKHARFDAKTRTYRYFIHFKKDPFINEQSWYFPQKLDIEKMNEAAKLLIGSKDFTSLSKLHTNVKTNICIVSNAEWKKESENEWYFEISADRFLRNMVRATVGTLIDVGLGKTKPTDLISILDAKDRGAASSSVPAHGLFLWKIEY
jgi:tRNA pseudouridine38-40 synthase